jgi:Zn-dependent alcohol dehydrogenase
MKAAVCKEYNTLIAVEEVELTLRKENEVLVKTMDTACQFVQPICM